MNNILRARLKKQVEVGLDIGELDFNNDWLEASFVIENAKRRAISSIKEEMHRAIAELSIDDIEFKIIK